MSIKIDELSSLEICPKDGCVYIPTYLWDDKTEQMLQCGCPVCALQENVEGK